MISLSMTWCPSAVLVLIASERLLLFSIVKYSASRSGIVAQLAAGDVAAAGALDLEDVRAEPGEHLGARRARLDAGEVDDLDACERQLLLRHFAYFPSGGNGAEVWG